MNHEALLLSNQLCFLVHRLDRAIGARYRPLLARLGLTYPQYLAMLALWEREQMEVGQLCEMLDLDTGTVSPLVKRLEVQGLVTRTRSTRDERIVLVSLSSKGRALEAQALPVPQAIAGCLLAGPEEYKELKTILSDLLARLEASDCRSPDTIGGSAQEPPRV